MFRALTASLLVLLASPVLAGPLTLVSRAEPGRPSGTAGGTSRAAGVSADGRYAVFLSHASNLQPGTTDANQGLDVYLHDRIAGTTVLVSHAAGDPSTPGDGISDLASISTDGRWVAYLSRAGNLVAGQVESEASWDVFLYDRISGINVLASHVHGSATTAAGGASEVSDLSADGSRIAFVSWAADLASGQIDEPGSPDVFLYDRVTSSSTLVSHLAGSANSAAGWAFQVALSANGNWVAFGSEAEGMVAGGIDSGVYNIYLYGRDTGEVVLVSHVAGAAAAEADDGSYEPRISADGSRVAYLSYASNLMAGQIQADYGLNAFLYDRATGTSVLVSHRASSSKTTGNGSTSFLRLSADGRWVAFSSEASNLVAGDAGTGEDVFLYNRITGANRLVSRSSTGPPANGRSWDPQVAADGSFVVFQSRATDLVSGQADKPETPDLFLWTRATGTMDLVTHAEGSPSAAATGSPEPYPADDFRISSGGGWIVLTSLSVGLVSGIDDANAAEDVFLYERTTGESTLVSSRGGEASESAGSSVDWWTMRALSNDGRYLAFTTRAPNLIPGTIDGNNASDVVLYDRIAGTSTLVSHASGSPATAANGESHGPLISAGGGALLFLSDATDLVPGQTTTAPPALFHYDRASGALALVSPAILAKGEYALSGDGRWVAFASVAVGQTDTNGGADVSLWDRSTGESVLVSHASGSPAQAADGASTRPGISADGRYVVFRSSAADLVPGPVGRGGLYLYDRISGTNTRIAAAGDDPTISADGRWVAFFSSRTDIVPGQVDNNLSGDVFLWDRASGSTVLASHTPASPTTTGNEISYFQTIGSGVPVLSADGRRVVFVSRATDLVPGQVDSNLALDVFLFDRVDGTVTLVSRSAGSPVTTGDFESGFAALSADGRFAGFHSSATNLVPGQVDGYSADAFLHDRTAGTTTLLTHVPSSDVTTAGTHLDRPQLSADGAWAAFESPSPDLVPGDRDGRQDVFLHANPVPGRDFFTLPPCRVFDTRQQGPALTSGVGRIFPIAGSCGIPSTARAVAVNVTAVQPTGAGSLTLHPGDLAPPLASTVSFPAGATRASSAVLALAVDGTGTLAVAPSLPAGGTVHLLLDVSGWFE